MDKEILNKANEQLDIIKKADRKIQAVKNIFNSDDIYIEKDSRTYESNSIVRLPLILKKDIETILLNYYEHQIKTAESIIENL